MMLADAGLGILFRFLPCGVVYAVSYLLQHEAARGNFSGAPRRLVLFHRQNKRCWLVPPTTREGAAEVHILHSGFKTQFGT